jgi:hypothetical protein
MGLKGYRLWAMCQLDSTCRAPPRRAPPLPPPSPPPPRAARPPPPPSPPRRSGTQAAFEEQTLKPVSHIIGSRVGVTSTRRLSCAIGQLHPTCVRVLGTLWVNSHQPRLGQVGQARQLGVRGLRRRARVLRSLVVAVHVDPFESKGLKPGFSLYRLKT